MGRIVETVPDGLPRQMAGQTVTIRLLSAGPRTVTYTVTATDSAGSHSFSGTIADETKNSRPVVGENSVTITAPPSTPEPTDTPTPDTDPSATRSFSATSVDPGEEITVTIRADNYGGLGRIVETLPSGFTSSDASGQTVTLRLLQEGLQTRSYTVTASDNPGSYTFSGVLESEDKSETTVGGSSTVTVNAPPGPSARRSFSTTSVDPGGTVTVTIRADNYGGLGRVVETLPSGFTSPDASGQTVTLRLLQEGPQTRSYTVTASENLGSYTFSGVLESEDKSETTVGGPSSVQVGRPSPPPPPPPPPPCPPPPYHALHPPNVEEMGEVTLWASATEALTMAPQVGDTITGAVMDPDGGVTGESWQWARTTTPAMMDSWMDIAGETNAAYTVTEGDTGYYLRVMATYTDAVGTDTAMEYSMPTMMVGAEAGDPLFGYDTSGNGRIDKDELAKAVFDYEVNRTLEKPALVDLVFSYEIGL